MHLSTRHWLGIALAEFLVAFVLIHGIFRGPDGTAHVALLDIGQGDAILLTSPSGKQILIDGGPDATVTRRLGEEMPALDRVIELMILTHPDADHLNGLPEVLRRYTVERVMLAGTPKDSARYKEFLSLIRRKRIKVLVPDPDTDIDMGDGLVLDIVWPRPGDDRFNANNSAIVIRAFYGGRSVLFTGDIERTAEEAIYASGEPLRADILKLAHHGSKTSTMTGFLLAVDPKQALVSTGRGNSYGHPHPQVLDRLRRYEIPMRDTAKEGTVEVEF